MDQQRFGDRDQECLLELFHAYATWIQGDPVVQSNGHIVPNKECGGLFSSSLKQLLRDLNLLDGLPNDRVDAYVCEVFMRADQDRDGVLSLGEFLVWFLTEVAVMLPIKRNGSTSLPCAPLYNRFVYYMLVETGAGVRRKASGLHLSHFLRMCHDYGVTEDEVMARAAVQVARTFAYCERAVNRVEGGTRLQLAQMVHALQHIAVLTDVTLDFLLYRLVGDGGGTLNLKQHEISEDFRALTLDNVTRFYLDSDMEMPLEKAAYECMACGKTHERWSTSVDCTLREYFADVGLPYMQQFRIVSGRNIRATFSRYCLKYNKGVVPPYYKEAIVPPPAPAVRAERSSRAPSVSSARVAGSVGGVSGMLFEEEAAMAEMDREVVRAERIWACCGVGTAGGAGGGQKTMEQGEWITDRELLRTLASTRGTAAGDGSPRGESSSGVRAWAREKVCCCQYQSSSLMELQTFVQFCWNNKTLRRALKAEGGKLNSHRLEAAFTTASSIEGVYSKGGSIGVHDQPVTKAQAAQLRAYADAIATQPVAVSGEHECRRCEPSGRSASSSARPSRAAAAAPALGVRPSSARAQPNPTDVWKGGLGGSAPAPVTIKLPSPGPSKVYAHRPPVPTLTYAQFLEALRLLAEDIVGHPQVMVTVELVLWGILCDAAAMGCPLPVSQKFVRAEDAEYVRGDIAKELP